MRTNTNKNKSGGYTLVEMVIYVGILSLISLVTIYTIFSFVSSYRNVTALRLAENSAIYSMERMSRDIMYATNVDSVNSVLGSNPGVLTITSVNNTYSTTTKYYLDSGVLKVDINGSYVGPLNSRGTQITSLVFNTVSSGKSTAVKIDMTINATVANVTKEKNYHNTVILRGSY